MNLETIPEKSLPDFFRDIEIVGSATQEVEKYKLLHAENFKARFAANQQTNVDVKAKSSPVLLASKSVKQAYQSRNYQLIKKMEQDAQNDLATVYNNVINKGNAAWTKVRKDGKEFYMSWSSKGSMWSYTDSITPVGTDLSTGETTYQATVQIGTYTATGKIVGIQSYNLTTTTLLVESVIAFIVAKAVSGIIAEGLGFLVARFSLLLVQAAVELGLEGFTFAISTAAIATVASCLVFAVVFIGLVYLWNWLNRKYTIRLQIFNWDSESDWDVAGQYMSNAKIAGHDADDLNFTIPKLVAPGDVIVPPGFDPVEALDAVCSYAVVIWENDNTFMEGCSMAIKTKLPDVEEGFMWAFDCPRWSDDQQAASNGLQDPRAYRNNAPWNSSPKSFSITSTSRNLPVTLGLDALSGASDNLYNAIININPQQS